MIINIIDLRIRDKRVRDLEQNLYVIFAVAYLTNSRIADFFFVTFGIQTMF